jgi:hypothetical protein
MDSDVVPGYFSICLFRLSAINHYEFVYCVYCCNCQIGDTKW